MNNNINLLVLKSFFDKGTVWLDEIELLLEDYAIFTRKLLSIEIENGKIPSLSLTLKNVDKLNFKVEDEIAYKKKLKAKKSQILVSLSA
jgi:major membrane immunogen (membrane-anchored lipoprotein)